MDKLYCHTNLVMDNGQVCAFAGETYEIINESIMYYEIINADGEGHLFKKEPTIGDETYYGTWFTFDIPEKVESKKTVGEILNEIKFLEDGMKSLQGTLMIAMTEGSSDSIINGILHDYRKLEIGLNAILETSVTINR